MRERVLHRTGKDMRGGKFSVVRHFNCRLRRFLNSHTLQRGNFNHGAMQCARQGIDVDFLSALLYRIQHIDGDDGRNTDFHQLCRQVQISLKVCTVNNIQNHIGALTDEILSGDDLLKCIGGKRINSGKVGYGYLLVPLHLSLFFLHGNAGPVSYILIRACQGVEQRGFSRIGIARKGDGNTHSFSPSVDFYNFGIGTADGKLISAHRQLERITKGRNLAHEHLCSLGNSHIHNAALHSSLAVHLHDGNPRADLNVLQCFHTFSFLVSIG